MLQRILGATLGTLRAQPRSPGLAVGPRGSCQPVLHGSRYANLKPRPPLASFRREVQVSRAERPQGSSAGANNLSWKPSQLGVSFGPGPQRPPGAPSAHLWKPLGSPTDNSQPRGPPGCCMWCGAAVSAENLKPIIKSTVSQSAFYYPHAGNSTQCQ